MSMVDITSKPVVFREAEAQGIIKLRPETIKKILKKEVEKGDVITVARIAAIMAVKNTPNILPLCHNIPITGVSVNFDIKEDVVGVRVKVKTTAKTGVEMEALTGVAVALLTIWDMVKKYEKDEKGQYPETRIEMIKVSYKLKEDKND